MGRTAAQLSHVFSLQRPIDANARESSFLAYQTVLPLEAAQLAAAGMRSNSVRASVVHKAKKTQGGGQQTTRNSLQDLCASFAAQSVSVAVAMGVARRAFGHASDPGATSATDLAPFVDGATPPKAGLFVTTSSTRLLPHALPVRTGAHNLLATMREFATQELQVGMIRSLVPQQVASLRSICAKICDQADGVNVWAAWVLLIHMLSDPRLRKLVRASPITDHEVAAAYLFTNYARAEVTRRARMDQAAQQKATNKAKAQPADQATAALRAQVSSAQELSDKQTLSLKRKRPPCSGVVQVSGGVLDYWAAALASEYASILKLMITQSRALANQASVETLTGQAPPGFNSERNALLVDISARNAVSERRGPVGARGHDARARAQDRVVALPQRRGPAAHAHGAGALGVRRVQHDHPRDAHARRAPAGAERPHQGALVARRAQRDAARRVDQPGARRGGGGGAPARGRLGQAASCATSTTRRAWRRRSSSARSAPRATARST